MRNAARGLAGLVALLFLIFGVRYMFLPAGLMESGGLEAVSSLGLANVRALIGGAFLTFGILLIMHTVISQQTGALRFTILFLLLSIVGRIVSLIADGSNGGVVRNMIPAIILFVVSIASLMMFLRSETSE
ncbi:DUF4345 family protein [Candidatus Leptofilum sp.]|uniref:DUF4345 family protein n=1 Tax=Candidatus Leptofilum sp. TaxID=3241576 RepID=UPI003B5CB2F8